MDFNLTFDLDYELPADADREQFEESLQAALDAACNRCSSKSDKAYLALVDRLQHLTEEFSDGYEVPVNKPIELKLVYPI